MPPFAIGLSPGGLFKHVGIHLTLKDSDIDINYPSTKNWLYRTYANSMIRPPFGIVKYHGIETVIDRLDIHKEKLDKITLDDLYKNKDIMGNNFVMRYL